MKNLYLLLILYITMAHTCYSQPETRLMRFPTIHENQIAFSYAGDLYSVESSGGVARKLTSYIGYEMFPKFSPDGKYIAFTGQYDGNTEVFRIPAQGGDPVRLTYTATLNRDAVDDRMGPNNIVITWTPDGKNIIYRSRKQSFNDFCGALYSVSSNGGLSTELPLVNGGFCSYSPDGNQLAFNRVFREFRTWKYYKGGMADDIWIYNFATKKVEDITDNPAQDIIPMWWGNKIYFLSDRDRTMNLFVYNILTKETSKVTDFKDYDIKFPSIGGHTIVFENAGYIFKFDCNTEKYEKLNIIISDDLIYGRSEWKDASQSIRKAEVSPNGERIVLSARGEIFTLPHKTGITRNITQTSGVHEREATWSPDGKYIAYISDISGEFEIYMRNQDGTGNPVQLTKNADTYKFSIKWSPDSKKILWNDRMLRLQYVDVETQKVTLVKQSKFDVIYDFNWSPDSKWIVYDENTKNDMNMVLIYQTETAKTFDVTGNWYNSTAPAFSSDGKYLFFASARDFNPIYSQTEWNHAYVDMEKIYFVTLDKSTPSPLAPDDNEISFSQPNKTDNSNGDKKEAKTVPDIKIDTEGLKDRIIALPVKASNYYNIYAVPNKVYYIEKSSKTGTTTAKVFDLVKKEEKELGSNVTFSISANNKKMLVKVDAQYGVIDLPDSKITLSETVDLSNMKVFVDYKEEWKQIYDEAWRQMRDFFYVSNMHGLNWKAIHDKYAVLVPYVKHRSDLTYLIGEMIGELSIGHTYVNSGQKPLPIRIQMGLLGAKLVRDASGYYKIDKILEGANWNSNLRSPLTEVGVNVKEGDFIIAVNGKSTNQMNDIYASLIGTADKQVELTVNSSPSEQGSRKVIVVPIAHESFLYYYQWVQKNIRKVNSATNGEVGYVHVPDMGTPGLNEFAEYFYPQLDKKALIIDDRGNGGGNVSPMIIERLQRVLTRSVMMRNVHEGRSVPNQMMLGPKVLLIDNYSASDGDLFPYAFKKHQLGKVIGMRTWGGVVGISSSLPFIDGSDLRKPEFASYSSDSSKWIIEGHGVDPDIMIDNDPSKEYGGEDAQLNKAIEVIKEELKNYKGIPDIPEAPDKSK